jgi:hypothetical protein
MWMRRDLLFLSALLLAACPASAQDSLRVVPGARVRVTLAAERAAHVGAVVRLGPDTLRLRTCAGCPPEAYPLASVTTLQLSTGRDVSGRRALTGLFLGALVGGAVGERIGARRDVRCGQASFCGANGALGAGGGVLLGALVGVTPAFLVPAERWVRVPLVRTGSCSTRSPVMRRVYCLRLVRAARPARDQRALARPQNAQPTERRTVG